MAVVLFADLSAVLPGDAGRVFAFLRKTSIVDDPGGNVMAGWGPGLWLVTRTLRARSSKTGWRLVAVSLGARHVPGTAYSLAAGFGQNVVLSTFFTLVFAAPLALLCRRVHEEG